jgi:hypothetical protein
MRCLKVHMACSFTSRCAIKVPPVFEGQLEVLGAWRARRGVGADVPPCAQPSIVD